MGEVLGWAGMMTFAWHEHVVMDTTSGSHVGISILPV